MIDKIQELKADLQRIEQIAYRMARNNVEARNVIETLIDEVVFQHSKTRQATDPEKFPSLQLARQWLRENE